MPKVSGSGRLLSLLSFSLVTGRRLFHRVSNASLFTQCTLQWTRPPRSRNAVHICQPLRATAGLVGGGHVPLPSDTVFALSSGAGVSGVAVIRISGPDALHCLQALLSPPGASPIVSNLPQPRRATLCTLYSPLFSDSEPIDRALVLTFPGPRSFTGEDVVELHVHGSRAVISATINALSGVPRARSTGIRAAERGEFTRRAFENGKMHLTQVEALADLLAANTEAQRKQAVRHLGGAQRKHYAQWKETIVKCLANAEAVIDFGDDVDEATFDEILPRAEELYRELQDSLQDKRGEIVRDGLRVVIVGKPNAGKSTLLNTLAKRPAAIVSHIPGTTRDVLDVALDLNGIPVTVSDTAGIRDTPADDVEVEGIRRARNAAKEADLTVLVTDVTEDGVASGVQKEHVAATLGSGATSTLLRVANKIDLLDSPVDEADGKNGAVFPISLLTNQGVDALVDTIECTLREQMEVRGKRDDHPMITRARHRYHIEKCAEALQTFVEGRKSSHLPMDIAAEELRIAARELSALTGDIRVEEVLDVVFQDFCIGK